ncbi:MAG TPA: dihydropteroate synthase [Kofleriaceae bacterium]
MVIREAGPDEWRTWRDLRLRALADAPDAFGGTLEAAQARDEASWMTSTAKRHDAVSLFAERDGVAVGMSFIMIADDQRKADLYAMWVAPEARGTGVGKQLVDAGLRWARSRAASDVALRVADTAHAARRLYQRCGFRDNGERSVVREGAPGMASTLVAKLPPLIMGVVNVTPDSFSDGGAYLDPAAAIAHGERLLGDGADILDIGGEATNPRAAAVDAAEEMRRVLPVIEGLATRAATVGAAISIDTTKAAVARAAVAAGASIVNDVSGGLFDPEMAGAVAELGDSVTYIAGHLRGRSLPEVFAAEGSVSWQTVAAELADRLREIGAKRAWIDPGIGFGKGADPEGNVALLRHAGDIASTIRRPIVVGPSRKRFLRRLLAGPGQSASAVAREASMDELDAASVLASLAAVRAGAQVVRVHNVALLRAALTAYNKE